MLGLLGRYEFQLDAKGRVSLPSAFRRAVTSEYFVLLRWQDTHLDLYPEATWQQVQNRLLDHRRGQGDGGAYLRRVTANAVEVELDNQGRIRVPSWLGDEVGLSGKIMLIGAVDRVELWNPDRFHKEMKKVDSGPDPFAAQIFGG